MMVFIQKLCERAFKIRDKYLDVILDFFYAYLKKKKNEGQISYDVARLTIFLTDITLETRSNN